MSSAGIEELSLFDFFFLKCPMYDFFLQHSILNY